MNVKTIAAAHAMLLSLPEGAYAQVTTDLSRAGIAVSLRIHATTRQAVFDIQHTLPASTWSNCFDSALEWWECNTEIRGVDVKLFACREPLSATPVVDWPEFQEEMAKWRGK